jgi:hypothetical protein
VEIGGGLYVCSWIWGGFLPVGVKIEKNNMSPFAPYLYISMKCYSGCILDFYSRLIFHLWCGCGVMFNFVTENCVLLMEH